MNRSPATASAMRVTAPRLPGSEIILTPEALGFVERLAQAFTGRIEDLLARRRQRQAAFDAGERPDFLSGTAAVRAAEWSVPPPPADLSDRRVEITGPTDRKMIINALNSGASVFMADFEDSNAPTWANLLAGQINLRDAVRRAIRYRDEVRDRTYTLAERTATLMVRPRGWHLLERHLLLDGRPVPASLADFGLFFFHNARALVERGTAPYFYLPKLEGHLEARLWNDVFLQAQEALGLPAGTIRATVLIETLPAAFEMDEILHELRPHSAGLNCGRWDYIFSFIKTLRAHPGYVLPDRSQVTMEQPNMRSYTQLLVRTCHRRGAHAMGGMAAQIPIREDEAANRAALEKVRQDKRREVADGHDGTWVAHPGLVPVAREVFDACMKGPHQIDQKRLDVSITADDLLQVPAGTRTEAGLRRNIDVGIQYLASWLAGNGCVPIYHLMEDAATAEISRTQVWQWLRHGARLDDGRLVTRELVLDLIAAETDGMRIRLGDEAYARLPFSEARDLFLELTLSPTLTDFLTIPAYDRLQE